MGENYHILKLSLLLLLTPYLHLLSYLVLLTSCIYLFSMEIYWQMSFLASFQKAEDCFMDAKGGPGSLSHPKAVLSMTAIWWEALDQCLLTTGHLFTVHGEYTCDPGHKSTYSCGVTPVPSAEVTCWKTRDISRMQLLHISEQNPGEYWTENKSINSLFNSAFWGGKNL